MGLNVPVIPAVTIDHVPVAPAGGVLPPSAAVVPPEQIVCGPPAVAVGCDLIVITTSAVASVHGALDTVHRRVAVLPIAPLVWVNVAPGVVALGLNVPATPAVTIDHVPVAGAVGVLPPRLAVVPRAQIVCGPPAVAVGACLIVTTTSAVESGQGELEIVHFRTTGPVPLV